LYILDRSVDLTAPLVHEFTYQAMANDLLKIEDGVKFHHEFASGSGEISSKDVILDENDSIWAEIRHSHIAECKLIGDFKKLMGENKAAASINKTETSLNDMKRILADLPQFQELKGKASIGDDVYRVCILISMIVFSTY
jgi:syntaxin-binding protein 1